MFKLTVPRDLLAAAQVCAADKDLRFYLNGVFFDAKNKTLVSTDGHMALIGRPAACQVEGDAHDVILPNAFVDDVLKNSKKNDLVTIDVDTSSLGVLLGCILPTTSVGGLAVDGKFPDWRRIYSKPSGEPCQVAAPLLTRAAKANKLLGARAGDEAYFWIEWNGTDGSVIRLHGDKAHVVVMPYAKPKKYESVVMYAV